MFFLTITRKSTTTTCYILKKCSNKINKELVLNSKTMKRKL